MPLDDPAFNDTCTPLIDIKADGTVELNVHTGEMPEFFASAEACVAHVSSQEFCELHRSLTWEAKHVHTVAEYNFGSRSSNKAAARHCTGGRWNWNTTFADPQSAASAAQSGEGTEWGKDAKHASGPRNDLDGLPWDH